MVMGSLGVDCEFVVARSAWWVEGLSEGEI
jgi:hypothetical protein